ncbi:MAG: outer membrane lipoprotein-sorting protein [Magnetococcales bacterium]|nr:outer membrane lipoprotein-sorting protein [Magnetococcales bacterium]
MFINSASNLAYGMTAQELSGRAIMATAAKKQYRPFVYEQLTITRTNADGLRTTRKARRYSRREQGEGSVNRHVIVLDYPKPVKGVAFLIKQMANGIQGHWVYLPALKSRMRRIVGGGDGGVFDTDFSIEDLATENLASFIYKRKKDLIFQKTPHYIIEARPKNRKIELQSNYSYRRIYIDRKQYKTSRIDYYNQSGELIKKLTNQNNNSSSDSGLVWRAGSRRMENKLTGTYTTIKTTRRYFKEELVPKALFSRQKIANGILLEQNQWNPKKIRAKTPLETLFNSAAEAKPDTIKNNNPETIAYEKPASPTTAKQKASPKTKPTAITVVKLQTKPIITPTIPTQTILEPLPKTTKTPKYRIKQKENL